MLVQHLYPQQKKFLSVRLVRRHQVSIETYSQHRLMSHLKNTHTLHIIQTGINSHVEIVSILNLDLLQLLTKLLVLLTLLYNIRISVNLQTQSLLEKVH